jgi:hypothetical protein
MRRYLSVLIVILSLTATSALAAPCKTQGQADAPIAFPKHDESDIQFARSMVPVMLPGTSGALPPALTCTRSTVSTALGDYVIGGENGDAFPRMALRGDGKPGPVAYLVASPEAPGMFALVVHPQDSLTIVKRFYAGIPTDRRLAEDVRAAVADADGIMAFDGERKMVSYAFERNDGVPPPLESVSRADGTGMKAGPQIMILDSGDPKLLSLDDEMKHMPSGFACPSTFDGLPVLLMTVDPRPDYLACSYRAGTELRFREDDPIRYEVSLMKARPGDTPRGIFDQLTAAGRAALHIKGDHVPPLATGSAPAPEFAAFWDTDGDGVQGAWVGRAGGWIISLRAQYPPGAANDTEAGKVAHILFTRIGEQVR